ncbi:481_t:CDS:1, partial [Funneliformis caledonium]
FLKYGWSRRSFPSCRYKYKTSVVDYDPNITDDEKRDLQDFTSTIASPLSVQVEVEIIPIHGIACQSCVKSITNAVSSLSGIVNIS